MIGQEEWILKWMTYSIVFIHMKWQEEQIKGHVQMWTLKIFNAQ